MTIHSRILPIIGCITALLSVACQRQTLHDLERASFAEVGYGSVAAKICTSTPSPARQNLKYLFILDHSSSNKPNFPNPLTPNDVMNTDPSGARRYGPMVNFINTLVPDTNTTVSFGLIDFNDDAYQPDGLSGFDSDAAHFLGIVTQDWIGTGTQASPSPDDKQFTNYQKALALAVQLVKKDAQMAAAAAADPIVTNAYQIIFVSDGIPSIATGDPQNPIYTQTFAADLSPEISTLQALKNDPSFGKYISNVTLNTAYYTNDVDVPAAATLLQQLADAGLGQFMKFATGQNILYQQFAPPPRMVKNQLVDVFIENANANWTNDGRLLLDSDSDGLADNHEVTLGSSPDNRDSDGNGVSDYVEYRTKGRACDSANCTPIGRDPYAICSGFTNFAASTPANTVFNSSTLDQLNDCEKFLLGGNRNTFNTNGSLVPDWLAFKNGLPINPGSAAATFADPLGDGMHNYQKLKAGLPIAVSVKSLTAFDQRATSMTANVESSDNSGTSCFDLRVDKVALTGLNNKIRLFVVQNSSVIGNKPFLMIAEKPIQANTRSVSFSQEDFK